MMGVKNKIYYLKNGKIYLTKIILLKISFQSVETPVGFSKRLGPAKLRASAHVPCFNIEIFFHILIVLPLPHYPSTFSSIKRTISSLKMASTPSKSQILSLFRSLLRTARDFSDYNIREYTKRRTIDGFRHNRHVSDPSSIAAAYSDAESQLQIARRQVIVYSLYVPKLKSVMEIKHA